MEAPHGQARPQAEPIVSATTRAGLQLVLIVTIAATIGCDRVTKRIARERLAGAPERSFLAGTVRLAYAENAGGFLSLGEDLPAVIRTAVFTIGTGMMLLALTALAFRFRGHRWRVIGLTLFAAGGASNWADRVTEGRVVDFLNVGVGPVRTGVFNVADVAIMCGVGLLLIAEIGGRREDTA
jgi:signal peptidase II